MAKKKKGDDEEAKGGKGKKLLPVILLLAGLVGGKMFFGKPAPKTEAEIAAEEQAHKEEVAAVCAEHNGGSHDDATGGAVEGGGEGGSGEHQGAAARPIDVRLVSTNGEVLLAQGGGGGGADNGIGPVLELEPVTLNLADGHYLKMGLALQLPAGIDPTVAGEQGLGAMALDMAISELSAMTMDELQPTSRRAELKYELGDAVCNSYGGNVLTVYFTEFVMQ